MGILSSNANYVRIVHLKHWETHRSRFSFAAFNRSKAKSDGSSGGVSVVSADCVRKSERSICEHLRHYYPPNIVSDPAVFLPIQSDEFPGGEMKQETTDSGDECHYNLIWTRSKETKFLESFWDKPEKLIICTDKGERSLDVEDIKAWQAAQST